MKAKYRCHQIHQGDRCRLERGHADDTHTGQFTAWRNDGSIVHASTIKFKRNRSAVNMVRALSCMTVNKDNRPGVIEKLGALIKLLRGE